MPSELDDAVALVTKALPVAVQLLKAFDGDSAAAMKAVRKIVEQRRADRDQRIAAKHRGR